jgi:hypothetical protein
MVIMKGNSGGKSVPALFSKFWQLKAKYVSRVVRVAPTQGDK